MTPSALNKVIKFIKREVIYGKYIAGGKTYKVPLHKVEVEANNRLAIYLLADHKAAGTVTRAQLYDIEQDIWDDKTLNMVKTDIQGVLIKFAYEIKEV
ncbi:MAG: hypothetical protein HQP61_02120 [Peptococcaceae bacterium]|nr:hypothetical protein [Candidatus Syntrophopropionicum ammoniitolerans]